YYISNSYYILYLFFIKHTSHTNIYTLSLHDALPIYSFEKREDGLFKRTLNKIKSLWDVSIVSMPAYNDTDVAPALRSIEAIKESEQEEVRKVQQEEQRKLDLAKVQIELLKLK